MDSKKVLILGITHPQIDAILYFKKQGFKVHGLSWQKEGMALPFIDHFEQINITDIKSVLDYTKKIILILSIPLVLILQCRQ